MSYDADPNFKYLSPKDQKDAKRLIELGDQLYFPETKKGLDALDLTFLRPEQRAWLEARDVLAASVRYSQEKGAPKGAPSEGKAGPVTVAASPEPLPEAKTPEFAQLVDGLMAFTAEKEPGPKAREAVKKWVLENVSDQGRYQQLLMDLTSHKQILTLHEGKVILEGVAKVHERI